MLTKHITQNLEWIDNNPDSNPVLNEKTTIITSFLGIPLYTKILTVTHTGEYKMGSPTIGAVHQIKGFGK